MSRSQVFLPAHLRDPRVSSFVRFSIPLPSLMDLSDLNSSYIRVHSYLRVSPGMQKYIENVRARHVHAWQRNKPPWLERRRPYVQRLYMYACVQLELAMVYVHVSGYYFVNMDYVEPTR